ncbi:nuclear transport factor 2 family protein [Motiliproteus sp.]|uniref:nuclear transport factor 2 family protein n=1 Tax=Motiliproteus sp. TaxID=1898955 RepID=UPI003BAB4015
MKPLQSPQDKVAVHQVADSLTLTARQRCARNYFELFNRLHRYQTETASGDSQLMAELGVLVSDGICFEDPFGAVEGRKALTDYLIRFAEQVEEGHFELLQQAGDDNACMLLWRFSGFNRRFGDADGIWCFEGVSVLYFDDEDKICRHIDYWDSGTCVYQKLPVLGGLIRWIKRRIHQG